MTVSADDAGVTECKISAPDLATADAKAKEYVASLPSTEHVIKRVVLSDGQGTIRGVGATVESARRDAWNRARSLGANAKILDETILRDPLKDEETVTVFAETPEEAQATIRQRYGTHVPLENIDHQSEVKSKRRSFLFWSWEYTHTTHTCSASISARAIVECRCACDASILIQVGPRRSKPSQAQQLMGPSSRDAGDREGCRRCGSPNIGSNGQWVTSSFYNCPEDMCGSWCSQCVWDVNQGEPLRGPVRWFSCGKCGAKVRRHAIRKQGAFGGVTECTECPDWD